MTADTHLHEIDLAAQDHAARLLSALHDHHAANHLLGDEPAPTSGQIAMTLRALSDFPLCIRILPFSSRRYRSGDKISGVSHHLAGFAEHLAHHELRTPYQPGYWILGEPVTHRLLRLVAHAPGRPGVARPSARQSAATLLALADRQSLELPRRMVEVAGDGDLPWNGSTGIGLFLQHLADRVDES